jgi:hypothetical protein
MFCLLEKDMHYFFIPLRIHLAFCDKMMNRKKRNLNRERDMEVKGEVLVPETFNVFINKKYLRERMARTFQ